MLGTRLFFDFVLWKQNGSPDYSGFTVQAFAAEAPVRS
jgi:hypothetical protein